MVKLGTVHMVQSPSHFSMKMQVSQPALSVMILGVHMNKNRLNSKLVSCK